MLVLFKVLVNIVNLFNSTLTDLINIFLFFCLQETFSTCHSSELIPKKLGHNALMTEHGCLSSVGAAYR